ncbi:glycosyltransferase family 4 protein [Actinomadura alba]|uniref:Glycosyltransferase family 4 protein n=1 Tax=Actinomadura alba TaxID=406431 RepID=A0ABR7M0T8_9ACTN|nr:glycosyltransferase family 4 protein [Actinomadura alba]MBC6470233.1 glycosyltransferase family 4 protein [Actinomadura alba]
MSAPAPTFVLPGDVDDVTVPSGGNTYDRRTCQALAAAGRPVREVAVAGTWPRPDTSARDRLTRVLAELPEGTVTVLDGLVACGVPEVVVPQARRLRLAVLVHLPLASETGSAPASAAELDARERETLQAAGAVVATSAWTARRLVAHHGLAADRVHVVPPGTDPAPLAPGTDGRSRLVCVAAVTPRKGQDLLVEALAAIVDLPWSCECVGPVRRDPAYAERLRGLIERRGLGDRITLAGPRTGEDLEGGYAAADLAVLPSRAEPYGMVVTEALARGIPVLATAVDGVPETLGRASDGSVPGILVPPGDPTALAGALRRWSADPGLRRRLRASAHLRRGALDGWDTTARQWADVLGRLQRMSWSLR